MSAAYDEVPRPVSERDLRGMLKDLEGRQREEARRTRAGIAAVCAVVFPGLGHLFQLRIAPAIVYALAAGFLGYKATGALQDDSAFGWAAATVVLWVINIFHAVGSAQEDQTK